MALALRIAREDIIAGMYRQEERDAAGSTGLTREDCLKATSGGLKARFALFQLRRSDQISQGTDGLFYLTPQGRRVAQDLVRSHRLWEAYLVEHFDLPLDHLHESAERVEHYIDPRLQEQMSEALNRPDRDPHGKPIPPGPA
jgi:manganese/zinc/iron transport system permease protein